MSSNEESLNIPEGGGVYLSGEYVKTKGIDKVKIVEPKPRMQNFDDGDKAQVTIAFVGQQEGDPNTWTLNNTTARALKAWFGTDKPSAWLNKVVPIEVSKTQKGYAIYADSTRFDKIEQPETKSQEVLL